MTPLAQYQRDLTRPDFHSDAAQARAVDALQDLHRRLLEDGERRKGLFGKLRKPQSQIGLYMWGGVGRGKTYLMDVFFESLPFADKERVHFHRFMQYVHREMRARQGEKNPLDGIARDFARRARVLCFDEFFVTDITDAMILATLLGTLFDEGVTLVATSNIVPDQLYRDGLQRARFLPAIALLNQHTKVLNVDGGTDYRLRLLEQAELYHCPLGAGADKFIAERFATLGTEHAVVKEDIDIQIEGRPIRARRVSDDVAWFEFRALCDGPRSQNDYIELAREYHTVLLANVERMGVATDDIARRFINLVDEFYDRSVKLIVTADVPIEDIYAGGRLDFEFARTRSRLLEMQSREYLAKPHLA
ncbi:cell division protein ZapE [Alcanivorax sp. 1008]|uniref:cell division protein ZapE n=1 Tax=Alcanivorax sp. 1008 TaxID=2816853 RepID=UPI001D4F401D|nr:cell division protein ZapE [Alcanivorax sp. 1008]MCC1495242.1 AFG1 family ATPase [Alcanivorax sp. 1008]